MGKDCPVCPKRGKIHSLLTFAASSLGWFRIYSSSCFFLWYRRDALYAQIFGCDVKTVLMLKGGFCLWGRPPLILRDIQAVSPATYEYGGTVPAFRFFSRHEVPESAHSVCFLFYLFFLGIMPFSTPLSFIFLFLFCPSFSAGFPNPLIPFACGKRTESLSGRTWLLYLFVYCFSFGCLFFL